MKMKMIYLAGILFIICAGCKKNSTNKEAPLPKLKMIKQTMYNDKPLDYNEGFYYDEQNRLVEIRKSGVHSNNGNVRYTYVASQVFYRSYISGTASLAESVDYTLNNAGLVQEVVSSYFNQRIVYEYNEQKYVKKVNYFRNGNPEGYIQYSYSIGNTLDSISFYSYDNVKYYVSIYTYEQGKRNTIGSENKGIGIFGKDQQMPLKRETRIVYNYPGATFGVRLKFFENTYAYSYSPSGNISSAIVTRTDFAANGASQSYNLGAYEYLYQ